jgi:signal transduction histidine kinase
MEMARLNAGVLRVESEPVNLADVAREAVHMLLPQSDARLQTLQMGRPATVLVSADHARVRQVLVNLIGNAVKFTPEGGSVTVDTGTRTVDGAHWREIRVTDTGPGIADADKAAIFEPYFRSEATAQLPGVGLAWRSPTP